jgi:hypothetical protein
MKMNKLITVAAVVLAAISFASTSASAQSINSVATNDLVLGFETDDGGSSNVLEVNLGLASQFSTSASTFTLSQVTNTDLAGAFGTSWASAIDIIWGVAGNSSGTGSTGAFDVTYNKSGAPSSTSSTRTTVSGQVNAFTQSGTLVSATPESDTTSAAQLATGSGTFSQYIGETAGDYGSLPKFSTVFNDQSDTVDPLGSLKLYSDSSSGATLLGSFTLASTGVGNETFTFTGAQAVPEPSAYALGICAMLLFWVLKRRSSIV